MEHFFIDIGLRRGIPMNKRVLLIPLLLGTLMVLSAKVFVKAASPVGTPVNLEVVSYFDAANSLPISVTGLAYGSTVSFAASLSSLPGYEFSFWIENGVVAAYPANHSFIVKNNLDLMAVFKPVGHYAVVFMDSNGKKIDVQFVDPGAAAIEPNVSSYDKPGYQVAETKWNAGFSHVTSDLVVVLQYVPPRCDRFPCLDRYERDWPGSFCFQSGRYGRGQIRCDGFVFSILERRRKVGQQPAYLRLYDARRSHRHRGLWSGSGN
jgi:hypothetical protein